MAKSTKKNTQTPIQFTTQEVTKLLLKQAGITQGHYFIHIVPEVRGGFVNLDDENGENKKNLSQGIIIGLSNIELREVPSNMPLAVDASQLDD